MPGTSTYPGALDSLPTNKAGTDLATGHAQLHDDTSDAINKIEATLGINPQGSQATVKLRLDKLMPAAPSAYTLTNAPAADRSIDYNSTTLSELLAVVMTLAADLQTRGIIG